MNNEPVAYGMLTFCKNCGEQNPYSVKELTDAITLLEKYADKLEDERPNKGLSDVVLECVEILRKAQEK